MKSNRIINLSVLSILAGVIFSFSFPKWDYYMFDWVIIVPLIYSMLDRPKYSFFYGLLFGLISNYIIFYWVVEVITNYSNIPFPVALLINLLLTAYLALYWGVWAYFGSYIISKKTTDSLWILPFAWVLLEYIRGNILTGFPWCLLGYSQYKFLPISQIASIAGIYGISFLLILANCAFSVALIKKLRGAKWKYGIWATVIIIFACIAWGKIRLENYKDPKYNENVGIVQGNIPQDIKWLRVLADEHFNKHIDLTISTMSAGAKLIVWPESAITVFLIEDKRKYDQIMKISKAYNAYLLIGADYREINDKEVKYFNSAFFIDPYDNRIQIYSKIHLVPFGEYVPLKRFLWFIDKFVEGVSDFSAGKEYTLFKYKEHKISTQICYEIIFPNISREFVKRGSELITTITNDAWFGKTSAPYQHFAMAVMRAIENKRYLVRSANTGISGIINPVGKIIHQSELFTDYIIIDKVSFLNEKTIYNKYGDWLCILSVLIIIIHLGHNNFVNAIANLIKKLK